LEVAGMNVVTTLVGAVTVFAATNVDDIVLLSVFFADPQTRLWSIVLGQFVGISVLVLVSAAAGMAAVALPTGWTSLLGVVPLLLGVYKGIALYRARGRKEDEEERVSTDRSQALVVAGVTIANGGDNLGAYIPLFAADRRLIAIYAAVFAVMTALWCVIGFKLVNNRIFGAELRRYGHVALPFVLVALGLYILRGGGWLTLG
jgi:cadmium resistance protein CadD (predicted permease)